eukprot:snap_masked-scaffold_1-processed-gene-22.52-mRNA-1 protein AED:1.00 eAED:1.00 QI:0/-1/0/0/-1/1/1/0/158
MYSQERLRSFGTSHNSLGNRLRAHLNDLRRGNTEGKIRRQTYTELGVSPALTEKQQENQLVLSNQKFNHCSSNISPPPPRQVSNWLQEWQMCYSNKGERFFYCPETQSSQWEDPRDQIPEDEDQSFYIKRSPRRRYFPVSNDNQRHTSRNENFATRYY